jgi:glycerate kinase
MTQPGQHQPGQGRPGHVVIATDKFKGSLAASEVSRHLAAGLHRQLPALEVRQIPVADGGEGTVAAALAGGYTPLTTEVTGPTGSPVRATTAVRGDAAVVELAQASGLQLVPPEDRRPLLAGSRGTGELVRYALDAGCRTVVLGVGGSASTDGGAGMLQALGARLLDGTGRELGPGGAALTGLATLDLTGLDPRVATTTFVLATDVDNVLLGPDGAATVFGPQKGATPEDVAALEAGLSRWAEVVLAMVGRDLATTPGAGAAGGVGFAALAVLGASVRPGIELLLEMAGFPALAGDARLVITGEGSLDEQSLAGKAPVGVSRAAAALDVPVVAVAGITTLSLVDLAAAGFAQTYTLQQVEPDLDRCIREAGVLLEQVGAQIAADWLTPSRAR